MADIEIFREHTIYREGKTGKLYVRGPHLPFRDLPQADLAAARRLIDWLCDSDVIELEGLEPPPITPKHPLLIRKWDGDTFRSSDMQIFQETDEGYELVNPGPIANTPYVEKTIGG